MKNTQLLSLVLGITMFGSALGVKEYRVGQAPGYKRYAGAPRTRLQALEDAKSGLLHPGYDGISSNLQQIQIRFDKVKDAARRTMDLNNANEVFEALASMEAATLDVLKGIVDQQERLIEAMDIGVPVTPL